MRNEAMKISTAAAPLLFAVTMLAAGAAAVTQANAAEARLSDVAYVNAAHCAGLAHGVGIDASGFDQVVSRQGAQREGLAQAMADQARTGAAHQASASTYWRTAAASELNGACSGLLAQDVAKASRPTVTASIGR
jgi:hypothetical protein